MGANLAPQGKPLDNIEYATDLIPPPKIRFGESYPVTAYVARFTLPAPPPGIWVPYRLHLEAAVNGQLYLNGHCHLGSYWAAGPQRDFYLPECWLNFDKPNFLTFQACKTDSSPNPIKLSQIQPYLEFAEKR
jgi:hypothetical protein